METILHTTRFWLTSDGRLEVYDYKLATRLNRLLKAYDNGKYTFQEGEEALFKLESSNQIDSILCKFLRKNR